MSDNYLNPAFGKTALEKFRLPIQRLMVVIIFTALLLSDSAWEKGWSLLASVFFFIGCGLAAAGAMGRMWCSLYIGGYKNVTLITSGPYSICRNPLYFFSMVGFVGVGMISETLIMPLILFLLFTLYYPIIIKSEERRLAQLHGEVYAEYLRTTPQLWPRFRLLREPVEYLTQPIMFRRHIFSAMWFVWLIGVLEIIETLHEKGMLPVLFSLW